MAGRQAVGIARDDQTGPDRPTDGDLRVRLDEERRRASLLGDLREAIFGAQDGLVSTLAV